MAFSIFSYLHLNIIFFIFLLLSILGLYHCRFLKVFDHFRLNEILPCNFYAYLHITLPVSLSDSAFAIHVLLSICPCIRLPSFSKFLGNKSMSRRLILMSPFSLYQVFTQNEKIKQKCSWLGETFQEYNTFAACNKITSFFHKDDKR